MKTLLVLGATSDIGLETARKFAANRYNLLLASRNSERLKSIQAELETHFNIKVTCFDFDATATETHYSFCEKLPDKIDVTLIAFGINGDPELSKQGGAETELLLRTNFTGAVSVIHALLQTNKITSGTSLIVLSSVAGERGKKFNYVYGATKAALSFYLGGLRADLFSKGIHVMTVKPGYIRTKMLPASESPDWITSNCKTVAADIYNAYVKKRDSIYSPWHWRYVAVVIKAIPGWMMKRLNF